MKINPDLEYLTINEVAIMLKKHYNTVYAHKHEWGFFQMEGSRLWVVKKKDLEASRKKRNNVIRLALESGKKEAKKCHYTREATRFGSILQHPAAKELDALLG